MDTSNKKSIKQGRWAQKIKNLKRSKRKDKKEKEKKKNKGTKNQPQIVQRRGKNKNQGIKKEEAKWQEMTKVDAHGHFR